MAQKAFLQSTKVPYKRYEILKYDAQSKIVTLKNTKGEVFEHPNFSKSEAEKYGYRLETVNDDEAVEAA